MLGFGKEFIHLYCWVHATVRELAPRGAALKWQERTPALAAGLTDHRRTVHEFLTYPVPIAARPKRGRRPSWLPAMAAA